MHDALRDYATFHSLPNSAHSADLINGTDVVITPFLGWGAALLKLEDRVAGLVAALLAASGVIAFFIATLAFGRRGSGRALDGGDDGPVVRR